LQDGSTSSVIQLGTAESDPGRPPAEGCRAVP